MAFRTNAVFVKEITLLTACNDPRYFEVFVHVGSSIVSCYFHQA